MEHSTLLFINNGHSVFFKKKKSIFGCSGSSLLHMGFLKLWRVGAGRDYSLAALASLVAEPQGARASVAAGHSLCPQHRQHLQPLDHQGSLPHKFFNTVAPRLLSLSLMLFLAAFCHNLGLFTSTFHVSSSLPLIPKL